jgi:hypothetical protein
MSGMLAILCSRHDAPARAFATRHGERNVRALTCSELSQPGWRLCVRGERGEAHTELTGLIGGRRLASAGICGVITRLPAVTEEELPHIVSGDRAYVASEMHAFLFAFLAALHCPVVNPPSPACLCGPNLRPVQWRRLARELGIPLLHDLAPPPATDAASTADEASSEVTIVREQTLGAAEERLRHWSRRLAQRAGVPYLRVHFARVGSSPRFVSADTWPCLESEEIGDALLGCFDAGAPC